MKYIIEEDYLVVDLETTGFTPNPKIVNGQIVKKGCEIIEIGVTELNKGIIKKNYSRLIKPEEPIPYHITKITNITNDMVKDSKSIEEVLPKFREFIGDKTIIGHNISFDIRFLNYFLEKLGLPLITKYICTQQMLKETGSYDGKNEKLGTACEYYDIKLLNAHRAYADTYATAKLFLKLVEVQKENLLA